MGPAAAVEQPERDELSTIRQRIEVTEKSREELRTRLDRLDQELAENEKESGRLSQAIERLEGEARERTRRIAELKHEQSRLAGVIDRHRRAIIAHARSAYAAGRQDWLKLLLNQEDPSRLARILAYHSYLNRARSQDVRSLDRELVAARALQDRLLTETRELRSAQERLASEQAALSVAIATRRRLITGLDREIRANDAELARLREDEQRLEALLETIRLAGLEAQQRAEADSAKPPPLPPPGGRSTCPVQGRILASFGGPKAVGRWDGMLIEAAEGTPVRAVAGGRVVFSDWLRGYGLLTIVDHGNGIMSLYAFNQSLYKSAGEEVAAGEPIAAVGASGGRNEPGLYFGMREQGKAIDPLPWCRG